jgi:hypothetical protein
VWSVTDGVFRAAASGRTPAVRVRESIHGTFANLRDGALYSIEDERTLWRAPLAAPGSTRIVVADARIACADASGDSVFYATMQHDAGDLWGHGPVHGTLWRARADGAGRPERVASGFDQCLGIRAAPRAVWFRTYSGIYRFERGSSR